MYPRCLAVALLAFSLPAQSTPQGSLLGSLTHDSAIVWTRLDQPGFVAVRYGTRFSKWCITCLIILALLPAGLLIARFDIGYMYLYFIASSLLLLLFLVLLWRSSSKKHFVWLHNILKFIIVSGVFGILLIDIDLVLNRLL